MERIGGAIERELARGGSKDALPLAVLTAAWPEIVGDAIARNAWPLRIARDGTLHVATSSATWANELTLLGDDLLGRLRDRLGADAPAQLRCAVGPIPEPAASIDVCAAPLESPQAAPPEVVAASTEIAATIADPELRELVARAARASLLRGASDRHF